MKPTHYPPEAVAFEYVPLEDPIDGGGASMDFNLVPGMVIEGEGRCCERCRLIWGRFGVGYADGGFVAAELRPLTESAREMLRLVEP
jgi:hypothetical protein